MFARINWVNIAKLVKSSEEWPIPLSDQNVSVQKEASYVLVMALLISKLLIFFLKWTFKNNPQSLSRHFWLNTVMTFINTHLDRGCREPFWGTWCTLSSGCNSLPLTSESQASQRWPCPFDWSTVKNRNQTRHK